MWKKIFKELTGTRSDPDVDRALAALVEKLPESYWGALVRNDGIMVSCFPSRLPVEEDRISAMSAAMLSLGERIAGELGIGDLGYSIIAGANGLQLVLVLDAEMVLALGLRRDVSVDSVLGKLRQLQTPLLELLKRRGLKGHPAL